MDGSNNSSLPSFSRYSNAPGQETLAVKILKFVLYALVFIVGFGGNSIVIWIMISKKKARTFHNILLCNLAAADIALLSINLPFRLAYQENNYVWPFGQFLCKVIPMFTYLFLTASSLTLVAISYERYRTIASLEVVEKTVSLFRKLQIASLWVISCLITLPLNIFLNVVDRKGKLVCTDIWPSETLEKAYFTTLFVIQFLFPTILMVVIYIKVVMILKQTRYTLRQLGLSNNASRHRKTIRMICIIVIVYITLTLPYHITWQMSTYGIKNSLAKKFSVLFLTATSASHPIIYGTLHQEFAQGFKVFLRCSAKARKDFVRKNFRKLSFQRNSSCSERHGSFVPQLNIVNRQRISLYQQRWIFDTLSLMNYRKKMCDERVLSQERLSSVPSTSNQLGTEDSSSIELIQKVTVV